MDAKVFPVKRSDAEWRRILTPQQYDVMRGYGTEAPGSCALLNEKRPADSPARDAVSPCLNPS